MTVTRGAGPRGTVSVVIPAFRAAGTIARAVHSVLAEPVVGEVIVVIDGPDDALRRAVPDDGRVRVIETPTRRGAPAARNRGLADASGAFALFLDADDFVEGGLIAALAGAAAEADLALGSYAFAFASGNRIAVDVHRTIGAPTTINVLHAWFEGHYVPCCSVLWRTAFVRGIGGWNEDLLKNQDGELMWRASRAAPRIALAAEGLGIYMQSPSVARVSNNRSASAFEQQIRLLACIENEMTAAEAPMLRGPIGASYYRLARGAYYSGFTAVGRAAERAARRLDYAGHAGTLPHRVAAAIVGLRRKEHFCARLHRFEAALGLRAVADGAAAAR